MSTPPETPGAPPPDQAPTRVLPTRQAPPPRRGPRRTPPGGIWPWLAALLLIVVGGILLAYFLTRDNDKNASAADVSVPALVGFGRVAAVRQAHRVGLRTAVRLVLAQQAAGTVTAQSPDAGARVPRGSLVSLTVSKGPPPVVVPNLIGLNEAQAGVKLSQVGLKSKVVRVTSNQASGDVIAQKPQAGAKVEENSIVTVTVSKGAAPATTTTSTSTHVTTTVAPPPPPPPPATPPGKVPNVVGQNLAQAMNILANAGYSPQPKPVKSSKHAGTIVSQSPAAGAKAKPGTAVTISFALPQP